MSSTRIVRWSLVALLIVIISLGLGVGSAGAVEPLENHSVADLTLEVAPQPIAVNDSAAVTVTATDANGSDADVTPAAAITVANGSVAKFENGSVTGLAPGSTTVTAAYGNETDSLPLSVHPPLADLVSVWDRSLLPLRIDHGNAAMDLLNQFFILDSPDGEQLNTKDDLGVFEPGPVTLDYSTKTGADVSQWSNRNVTVVDGSPTGVGDPLGDPSTLAGIADGGLAEVNKQLEFEEVKRTQLDFLGRSTFQYPVSSGQHFALMATIENQSDPTVTVEDGNLSVTGETTIIGAEGFFVQADSTSVSTTNWAPAGVSPDFSLDAPFTNTTNHSVFLYDRHAFEHSILTLNITDSIDSSLTRDDLLIEPSIDSMTGPLSMPENLSFANRSITDLHRIWPTSILDITGFIASNATFEGFQTDSGNDVLNASVTANSGEPITTMTVGTHSDWGAGTYRWIHLASNETSAVASNTGTIEIGGVALESLKLDLPAVIETTEQSNATVTASFANNESLAVTDLASFTSSNETVATIDDTGTLTPKTPGETTVTATYENGTATATVTVEPTPAVFDLEIPNDGTAHTIASPGPLVGSLADLFPNGTAGITSVFSYDGEWHHRTDLASHDLSPREAIVITTDGGVGPETIPLRMEFALGTDGHDIEARSGWNLLSGTAMTDADSSFGNSSAVLVLDRYGRPSSSSIPPVPSFDHYVMDGTQWGADAPAVSPVGGYFVYHQTPAPLPVAVENVLDRPDAAAKLGLQ